MATPIRSFLHAKLRTLTARSRRLATLCPERVGLRGKDRPYAPSADYFRAANDRLAAIDRQVEARLAFLRRQWRHSPPRLVLLYMALVEREIDRARRTFGMFFEVFSQRGSAFAPALTAHDAIARDCYRAVRQWAPLTFRGPLLQPLTYMEHGYSPATTRRGIALSRLLGDTNPFPLIRIPWDRDNPWQAVFLHEVAHNLQADMGIWQENQQALGRRLSRDSVAPPVASVYRRWHKEIFADLAALLLGGPAAAWGMLDFLAHPSPKTLTYKPGGHHPTGYLRGLILAEMLARMGFDADATRIRKVWRGLYNPSHGHRLPARLLSDTTPTIASVVDEIAFQSRRGLAQRALADVIRFDARDEGAIRTGARELAEGGLPSELPPRFLVSASRYALALGADAQTLSKRVIAYLSRRPALSPAEPRPPVARAA